MNLFSFVNNPFTNKAEIDYKKLYEVAYEQQRLMDDLVDLEIEKIDKIIEKIENDPQDEKTKQIELDLWKSIKQTAKSGRRTGSGITALADTLAAVGVKYDSNEGLNIAIRIMRTKMEAELDCTIDLAVLRGPFEGWNSNKEFGLDGMTGGITYGTNSFYETLLEKFPDQAHRMVEHGRRQISWSTIAPTGSVSILCQTSSGCEPIFKPFYTRRRKVNPDDRNAKIDFTDQNGDTWQEYPVLHPKFKDWMEKNYVSDVNLKLDSMSKQVLQQAFELSPWYNATANDIDWTMRLAMQEVLQVYTTNAISSTINLREDISMEEVSDIYTTGSSLGLKGLTIYRENSRSGVLVAKKEFSQQDAVERPISLDCDIYHIKAKGNNWTVLVGLLENKPYEIFAISGNIATKYDKGKLNKKGNGVYNLEVTNDENITIHGNITENMTDEQTAITRLVSSNLRHRNKVQYITEQLDKSDGDIVSFTKAISRVLKRYISEEDQISRNSCDNCGSTNLRMEEGCRICNDCGVSACS